MDSGRLIENMDVEATRISRRRANKHLIERRRRARINHSLEQLKSLLLNSGQIEAELFEKMEKADILERTVGHLKKLQQGKLKRVTGNLKPRGYEAGYRHGVNEVTTCLSSSGVSQEITARLHQHLMSPKFGSKQLASITAQSKPFPTSFFGSFPERYTYPIKSEKTIPDDIRTQVVFAASSKQVLPQLKCESPALACEASNLPVVVGRSYQTAVPDISATHRWNTALKVAASPVGAVWRPW